MKKFILSAVAAVTVAFSALAVAPQSAEAIPAFARQTGAACLSCHFQTFPALTAFGRSFKQGGFTDVGEQALIEDEHMSIPSTLNATVVLRPQFAQAKVSGNATAALNTTTKSATLPADQVLLIAGRVGTNTGAFIEAGGPAFGFANFQLMNSFDLGGFKAGVNIFNTGFGETAGIELSNVFGQHGGNLAGKSISAANSIKSAGGNTGGVAFWGGNSLVNASVSLLSDGLALGGVDTGFKLANSLRVFVTPEVGGFGLGVGFGSTQGTTGNANTIAAIPALLGATTLKMEKQFIDFQAEGDLGGVSLGVYADFAKAKGSSGTTINLFNLTAGDLTGNHVRVAVKPTHNLLFGAGFGSMKKAAAGAVAATTTKSTLIAGTYEVYQNFEITLSNLASKAGNVKTDTWTLDIEALM